MLKSCLLETQKGSSRKHEIEHGKVFFDINCKRSFLLLSVEPEIGYQLNHKLKLSSEPFNLKSRLSCSSCSIRKPQTFYFLFFFSTDNLNYFVELLLIAGSFIIFPFCGQNRRHCRLVTALLVLCLSVHVTSFIKQRQGCSLSSLSLKMILYHLSRICTVNCS